MKMHFFLSFLVSVCSMHEELKLIQNGELCLFSCLIFITAQ